MLSSAMDAMERAGRSLCAGLTALLLVAALPAAAQPPEALNFGILPLGGPAESRQDWRPFLEDMARSLEMPVHGVSASTYEGIIQAIEDGRVDVAFLSGQMALSAVLEQDMEVAGQLSRIDGSSGYSAVLLVATDGEVANLAAVLNHAGRWRLARGEPHSVSGYLAPEALLFATRGIDSNLHFREVRVDNHQNTALAVANGEVDVATNNSADLERFALRFPREYERLRIVWQSPPIPHATMVISRRLPVELRARIRLFLVGYGHSPGQAGERERENLRRIHELSGFVRSDNRALLPFLEMQYQLERRRAENSRWISEAAKADRLAGIDAEYAAKRRQLEELTLPEDSRDP